MRRISFLACVAVLASACSDEPAFEGSFALTAIGDQALPAPSMATSTDTTFADTVVVVWTSIAEGHGELEHRHIVRGADGLPRTLGYSDRFRLVSGILEFIPPLCPPNALCAFTPHSAAVLGDDLVITFADPTFPARHYRRLR